MQRWIVPTEPFLLDRLPCVVREYPVVVEGCYEVIPHRARVPLEGRHIVVTPVEVRQKSVPSAVPRRRSPSRVRSVTASHPTFSPLQPSSSRRSAAAGSVGSMSSRGPGMSPSRGGGHRTYASLF